MLDQPIKVDPAVRDIKLIRRLAQDRDFRDIL